MASKQVFIINFRDLFYEYKIMPISCPARILQPLQKNWIQNLSYAYGVKIKKEKM